MKDKAKIARLVKLMESTHHSAIFALAGYYRVGADTATGRQKWATYERQQERFAAARHELSKLLEKDE